MNKREKEVVRFALWALMIQDTQEEFAQLLDKMEATEELAELSEGEFVRPPESLELWQVYRYIGRQPTSRR